MSIHSAEFPLNNNHMHLSSGIAVTKLFTPLPVANPDEGIDETTRRFKVDINSEGDNAIYEFVDCINEFDKFYFLDDSTSSKRKNTYSDIADDLMTTEVYRTWDKRNLISLVKDQVEAMCKGDYEQQAFTHGMIWFPDEEPDDVAEFSPEIYERIANGFIEFNTFIDKDIIRIINTEKCNGEAGNIENCIESNYFGFFIKKTVLGSDGEKVVSYLIDDPTVGSGYTPPISPDYQRPKNYLRPKK